MADSLKFQFATDGEGNYGYLGADGSFIPFKSGIDFGTVNVSDLVLEVELSYIPTLLCIVGYNNTQGAFYLNDNGQIIGARYNGTIFSGNTTTVTMNNNGFTAMVPYNGKYYWFAEK